MKKKKRKKRKIFFCLQSQLYSSIPQRGQRAEEIVEHNGDSCTSRYRSTRNGKRLEKLEIMGRDETL